MKLSQTGQAGRDLVQPAAVETMWRAASQPPPSWLANRGRQIGLVYQDWLAMSTCSQQTRPAKLLGSIVIAHQHGWLES